MISRTHRILYSVLVLVLLLACTFGDTLVPNGEDPIVSPTAARIPFVAENDGPPGFSAALSAPDIVVLTWDVVPEAVGYKLQIVFDGLDPLTIAYLPQDATRFVHLLAPEASLLTYRLQTVTSSGPAGASNLQIDTGSHAPNPLTVQAAFSEDGIASAVIGPAGGTLETTDGRGVTYTLVIPPGAIGPDLEISMTPISTIDGWPLDGSFLGGVRLEPEGWQLDETAYLTIRLPAAANPDLTTVGFAFDGSGEEFHLAPAYAGLSPLAGLGTGSARRASPARQGDAGAVNLPVAELGSSGAGETSADAAAAMAEEHAPTSSSDAADQKAAATDAADNEMAPLWTPSKQLEIRTDELLYQILNDIHDCNDFTRAVGSFHGWESKAASLGDDGGFRQTIMKLLAEQAVKVIENAAEECIEADKGVVPASVPCAERLIGQVTSTTSNPFYTELGKSIRKDPDLKKRFTEASQPSLKCPHSYGVNEAATIGYRWTSACIPSLDRAYQVAFLGPNTEGVYRLYPSDPLSGRMEGQSVLTQEGASFSTVEEGTYVIKILEKDLRGYPLSMDLIITAETTVTVCGGDVCRTKTGDTEHMIPLLVHDQRCPMP